MLLEYRIGMDDFREANRLMLRRYSPVLYAYARFAPLAGILCLAYMVSPHVLEHSTLHGYTMSTLGTLCIVFLVIVCMIFVPVGIRSSVARAYESNAELRHRFQVEITENWFTLRSTSGGTQSCRMTSYNSVLEGRRVFVLSRSSQAFTTIVKAGLQPDEIAELRHLLHTGVEQAEPARTAENLS